MAPSPVKPAISLSSSLPCSPLAHKQRRFTMAQDASSSSHTTPSLTSFSPSFLDLESKAAVLDNLYPINSAPSDVDLYPPTSGSASTAMQRLELESYAVQSHFAKETQKDKQTGATYKHYLNNYVSFWGRDQAERKQADPLWESVNYYPITATKAAIFLKYEMQREKKKRGSQDAIANSTVGKSVISGAITALEYYRFQSQHLYKDIPDTQTTLRQDSRIRQIEDAAKHKEPERVGKSLALKAAGTSCDTYKMDELTAMANWCLTSPSGPVALTIHICDRAMLLVSTVLAFRGDSAWQLLWSDLFRGESINHAKGMDSVLPVLNMLADNAKHNQNGRVDEHGALRHHRIELCAVGALALFFFAHWHVSNSPVPDFSPDESQGGEYGLREWYSYYIFHASDVSKPMSYDNHLERIKRMHEANEVATYKATHAARIYFAQNVRKNGATVGDTKALGGWSKNGSFRPCYDRELPLAGLLAAAGFNATKPEAHFLAREALSVPEALTNEMFPWIEDELNALIRRQHNNKYAKDMALREFLTLLRWFRTILIQDMAVLVHLVPNSQIFKYAPFNTESFRNFALGAMSAIATSEQEARTAFQSLPAHLVDGLRSVLAQQELIKQETDRIVAEKMEGLQAQMSEVIGMVGMAMAGNGAARRRTKKTVNEPLPPMPYYPSVQPIVPPTMPPITINISNVCTAGSTSAVAGPIPPLSGSMPIPDQSSALSVPTTLNGSSSRPPLLTLPPAATQNNTSPVAQNAVPIEDPRLSKWNELVTQYGAAKVQRHGWDWTENGSWVPRYEFQRVTKLQDVWKEHAEGLNGYLSVRELQEGWGASWMRNLPKRKTECSRRKKIITLIGDLTSKRRWTAQLALRFLIERYETRFKTARLFSDWLTKDKGANRLVVLREAESYP